MLRFWRPIFEKMGCFHACFKFRWFRKKKDDLQSSSKSTTRFNLVSYEHLMSKRRLFSLFLCQESNPPDDEDSYSCQSSVDKELKREANFLRACGTLLETPAEFRKASQKVNAQNQEELLPSNSHPLLPDASLEKLQWDWQGNEAVVSPLSVNDGSDSSVCKSGRYLPEELHGGNNSSFLTSKPSSADLRCQIRTVRSDGIKNTPGVQSFLDSSVYEISTPQIDHKRRVLQSKESPFPTPLKLTDEMETPGTVYSRNLDSLGTMKYRHIRSQYVYPVLKSLDNVQEMKSMKDNLCEPCGSNFPLYQGTGSDMEQKSQPQERRMREATMKETSPCGKGSEGDKPIIDDESSHISPKWWDGNDIPNSTTKYKEDQKISWHATPFVERLEKALLDDIQLHGRNLI